MIALVLLAAVSLEVFAALVIAHWYGIEAAVQRAEDDRLRAANAEIDERLIDVLKAEQALVRRARGHLSPYELALRAETESKKSTSHRPVDAMSTGGCS